MNFMRWPIGRRLGWFMSAASALAPLLLTGCAEMDALRSRNGQLEAEIAKLRNENGEFQKAYYQITQDRSSDTSQYMSRIEKLEREVSDARSDKSARETELERQVESLKNEIQATRDATSSKLVQSDQQLAQLTAQAGDVTQKAGQLEAQLAGLKAERDQLEKERARLQGEVETGKKNAAAAAAEMDAIKGDVEKIRAENAELKKENAGLKKQLEELGAQAKSVAAKSADLEKAVAKADLQNDPELKAWLEAAKERIDKHEAAAGVSYKQGRSGARVVVPSDAVFNKGTVAVSDSIKPALDAVAEALKAAPDRAVRIEGHTDNQPTIDMPYADNWELGAARANQIRLYLTERGVDQNRIEVISRSYNEPVADNKTPEGRAKNRRVEIILGRKIQ